MTYCYDLIKKYIPSISCRKKRADSNFLIVMNNNGEVFYLNSTASYIYNLFDNQKSISDIFYCLKNKFDANTFEDELIIKKDLIDLIRNFQWQEIIKLSEV